LGVLTWLSFGMGFLWLFALRGTRGWLCDRFPKMWCHDLECVFAEDKPKLRRLP